MKTEAGGEEDEAGGGEEEADDDEEREEVAAEGEGDAAEDREEEDAGEGEAGSEDGDGAQEEGADEGDAAPAEGEEAAVAGAEGGGGETQAGAGTATRERDFDGERRRACEGIARSRAGWRATSALSSPELEGTGPGGRIVKADVQAAAENGGGKAGVAEKGKAETADGDGADAGKDDAQAAKKDKKGKKKDKKADDKAEKKDGAKADKAEADKAEGEKAEAGVKGHVKVEELTKLQQTVVAPDGRVEGHRARLLDRPHRRHDRRRGRSRERLKEISDPVPSFNDMVVKACAGAARAPARQRLLPRRQVRAVRARERRRRRRGQDALVVPTIFDADQKSLGQITRDARAVTGKVQDKTITPPELSGGTFTVSNLGMFGIEQFTAIINPPQAAILTVGKAREEAGGDDKGKLVARDQMVLTLVCDHRILYGADGAEFLARVKDLLEQPLSLAL